MNAIHELQQTSILIVDDDLLTQSIIKAELESIGYHNIQTEDDGFVALDMLRENASINLIVLDLHMPKIDGVRFMRQLAAIRPTTDIILASGQRGRLLSTTISLGKSMGLNVLGALQKPVQVQALEELLERRQVQQNSLERIEDVRLPLLVADLRDGILGDRIDNHPHLMFQPIVSVATRSIVSVEVLARWWNRERGILTPELFLPLAEKQGLLDQLTRQIYLMTIEQVAEWFTAGRKLSAAVNLSINSFNDKSFAPFLIATAEQHGIDCARLIFEVAESQTSSVTPDCLEALLSLRLKGFRLSIDDFGTGSSSFTHVKNIPFTELKIDREFVTGAAIDSVARSILEESIKLAQRLHMAVVAEGVETRNEWCLAEQLGCDFVQGYYCAKPMDNKALLSFLDEWQGPHDNPDCN
jgi:EAL domain-containing protein (putative c-di-GMP-specific phosphodiesterase class I)